MSSDKFPAYTSYDEKILLAAIESFFECCEHALASDRQCEIHAEPCFNDRNTRLF
jgi:hypothetical protein